MKYSICEGSLNFYKPYFFFFEKLECILKLDDIKAIVFFDDYKLCANTAFFVFTKDETCYNLSFKDETIRELLTSYFRIEPARLNNRYYFNSDFDECYLYEDKKLLFFSVILWPEKFFGHPAYVLNREGGDETEKSDSLNEILST